VGLHFLHHPASVRLHGDFADAEFATNLLFNRPATTKAMPMEPGQRLKIGYIPDIK
jgi:hypothetical protein